MYFLFLMALIGPVEMAFVEATKSGARGLALDLSLAVVIGGGVGYGSYWSLSFATRYVHQRIQHIKVLWKELAVSWLWTVGALMWIVAVDVVTRELIRLVA